MTHSPDNLLKFPDSRVTQDLARSHIQHCRQHGKPVGSIGRMDFTALYLDMIERGNAAQAAQPPQPMEAIKTIVSECWLVPVAMLDGPSRKPLYVKPRWVAWFLIRNILGKTASEIGAAFGGRDDTTVLHGLREIERLQAQDPLLRSQILSCIARYTGITLGACRSDNLRLETLRHVARPCHDPDDGGDAA